MHLSEKNMKKLDDEFKSGGKSGANIFIKYYFSGNKHAEAYRYVAKLEKVRKDVLAATMPNNSSIQINIDGVNDMNTDNIDKGIAGFFKRLNGKIVVESPKLDLTLELDEEQSAKVIDSLDDNGDIAIGENAKASGGGLAIGKDAEAKGPGSIAIGAGAKAG